MSSGWREFPFDRHSWILRQTGTVLLETTRPDPTNRRSFVFENPLEILSARSFEEIPEVFRQMEDRLAKGYYLAGKFDYECGYFFKDISYPEQSSEPLIWLGVYRRPWEFDHRAGMFLGKAPPKNDDLAGACIEDLSFDYEPVEYEEMVRKIKHHLKEGDAYQVNFAGRFRFRIRGTPYGLYRSLREKQQVAYSAYLNFGETQALSLSPELFFRRSGDKISVRPMKGTANRGRDSAEDALLQAALESDPKNRAENVMIVDLLRNDLGEVSKFGSVKVPELFTVERYETLLQMTSTIESELKPGVGYYDLFKALFPCGSVTGAPKIRVMEIVRDLEKQSRGLYTGAIGYLSPNREAVFNVPIRTLEINRDAGFMGCGSGIVWDSQPETEYRECFLKAKFLKKAESNSVEAVSIVGARREVHDLTTKTETGDLNSIDDFEILETMLWDDGFALLEKHLRRMKAAVEYFEFCADIKNLRRELMLSVKDLTERTKVRILLNSRGDLKIETSPLASPPNVIQKIQLAKDRISSEDQFLYFKTTRREMYNRYFQRAREEGLADFIFLNERGEIAEGAISNVFIRKNGRYFTPPVRAGLLNGVYRQHLLETIPDASEISLLTEDLKTADAVYLTNAVQGMREVELI